MKIDPILYLTQDTNIVIKNVVSQPWTCFKTGFPSKYHAPFGAVT